MFFFEWLVPTILVIALGTLIFYFAVRNREGAGVRTEGRTVVDKPEEKPDR